MADETKYNPTCIYSGEKSNLLMKAHRNKDGEMVGFVFVNEKFVDNKNWELELNLKWIGPVDQPMTDQPPIWRRPKLDHNPHG